MRVSATEATGMVPDCSYQRGRARRFSSSVQFCTTIISDDDSGVRPSAPAASETAHRRAHVIGAIRVVHGAMMRPMRSAADLVVGGDDGRRRLRPGIRPRRTIREPQPLEGRRRSLTSSPTARAGQDSGLETVSWRAGACGLAAARGQRARPRRSGRIDSHRAALLANPREGQGHRCARYLGSRNGAAVYIRPDMDGLGPKSPSVPPPTIAAAYSIVYQTRLHELGHALGLSHTAIVQRHHVFLRLRRRHRRILRPLSPPASLRRRHRARRGPVGRRHQLLRALYPQCSTTVASFRGRSSYLLDCPEHRFTLKLK